MNPPSTRASRFSSVTAPMFTQSWFSQFAWSM